MKLFAVFVMGLATVASAQTLPAPKAARPLTAARPAAITSAGPPVFSFMGDDTETPTVRTTLNEANCSTRGQITSCADFSNATLAGRPMRWVSLKYNDGKLYQVLGSFGDAAYPAVRDAFVAKYGAPARRNTRKWQSRGGATFDNMILIWDFKGGRLELESVGTQVGSGGFSFVSIANAPPPEKPTVDF